MDGTIPVNYRGKFSNSVKYSLHFINKIILCTKYILFFSSGNNYNIPLMIVLPFDYPSSPPILTVNPASNMQIAQNHPHVEPSGRVRHEYLTNWRVSLFVIRVFFNTSSTQTIYIIEHSAALAPMQHFLLSPSISSIPAPICRRSCSSSSSRSLRKHLCTPTELRRRSQHSLSRSSRHRAPHSPIPVCYANAIYLCALPGL